MAQVGKLDITPDEKRKKDREPAHKLLDKFIIDNKLNLSYRYNSPRTIEGGGIIIDPPILVVNYTD